MRNALLGLASGLLMAAGGHAIVTHKQAPPIPAGKYNAAQAQVKALQAQHAALCKQFSVHHLAKPKGC